MIRKIFELNGLSWGELKRKGFIRVFEKLCRWKMLSGKIEFYF